MLVHADFTRLEESVDHIREAPADGGTVELIARWPGEGEREVLTEARLDIRDGLVGDTWRVRGSTRTPDSGPNPDAQLTLMNARVAAAIAGERERWPLAGDQLYVDLNSPTGRELRLLRANCRVIVPGTVRRGDAITKLSN